MFLTSLCGLATDSNTKAQTVPLNVCSCSCQYGSWTLSSTKENPQGILVKAMASCCGPRNPWKCSLSESRKIQSASVPVWYIVRRNERRSKLHCTRDSKIHLTREPNETSGARIKRLERHYDPSQRVELCTGSHTTSIVGRMERKRKEQICSQAYQYHGMLHQ